MSGVLIKDNDWITRAFLVNNSDLDKADTKYRFFSTVELKFTNTTPGGNFEVNPLPQFTLYADPPPAAETTLAGGDPMGRAYSEIYDDNSQRIYMRFGQVQFNSMWTFFTNFYNIGAGRMARTGRGPGIAYTIGRLAGMVVPLFFPKLLVVSFLGYASRFFMDKPSSKYCFLKPAMPLYWHAVQTIVNALAVNMGIVERAFGDDNLHASKGNPSAEFNYTKSKLRQAFPDVFTEKGSINVFAYANKAQRLAHQQQSMLEAASNNSSAGVMDSLYNIFTTKPKSATPDWDKYLDRWVSNAALGQVPPAGGGGGAQDAMGDLAVAETLDKSNKITDPGFFDFFKAELNEGAAFATFRVNFTGTMTESFSNSVGESDLASKINGMSAQGRATNFSLAGGNVLPDGIVASTVGAIGSTLKDFLAGFADGTILSGLGVATGGAFADIPKYWQNASATFNKGTYTVNLLSPYNNPISQLFNIVTPLAMLLAGVLPLSTGRQSYTAPFHLELYDRGRCQTRFGLIESLTIQRGIGNTGWSRHGQALGIEVSFNIVDLSSVIAMPISGAFNMDATQAFGDIAGGTAGVLGGGIGFLKGGVVGAVATGTIAAGVASIGGATVGHGFQSVNQAVSTLGSLFDDETMFSDYMATLGSLSLSDQIYPTRKLKLRLTRAMADWDTWFSTANYASVLGDSVGGRILSAVYKGTAKE